MKAVPSGDTVLIVANQASVRLFAFLSSSSLSLLFCSFFRNRSVSLLVYELFLERSVAVTGKD